MRAKIVLPVFGLALAVLAPALYFHFKPDAPAPTADAAAPVADAAPTPTMSAPSILKRVSHAVPQEALPDATSPASTGLTHDEYITQRSAELEQLGMTDDPANLKTILGEMQNSDPDIRKAALNATVDFRSRDAIPALENDLAYATDPQEKVDIQKAIDFLKLPSISEPQDAVTSQTTANSAASSN